MASNTPNPNLEIPESVSQIPVNVPETLATKTEIPATRTKIIVNAPDNVPITGAQVSATVPEALATKTEITETNIPASEITESHKGVPGIPASEITEVDGGIPGKKYEEGSSRPVKKPSPEKCLRKRILHAYETSEELALDDDVLGKMGISEQEEDTGRNERDNVNETSQNQETGTDTGHNEDSCLLGFMKNTFLSCCLFCKDDDPKDEWWNNIDHAMCVLIYATENMRIGIQDGLYTINIFPDRYSDWNALAFAVLVFWKAMSPDKHNHPELTDATPANCWPGSITIFGRITREGQNVRFERLNWTDHDFADVKHKINCLLAIQI